MDRFPNNHCYQCSKQWAGLVWPWEDYPLAEIMIHLCWMHTLQLHQSLAMVAFSVWMCQAIFHTPSPIFSSILQWQLGLRSELNTNFLRGHATQSCICKYNLPQTDRTVLVHESIKCCWLRPWRNSPPCRISKMYTILILVACMIRSTQFWRLWMDLTSLQSSTNKF